MALKKLSQGANAAGKSSVSGDTTSSSKHSSVQPKRKSVPAPAPLDWSSDDAQDSKAISKHVAKKQRVVPQVQVGSVPNRNGSVKDGTDILEEKKTSATSAPKIPPPKPKANATCSESTKLKPGVSKKLAYLDSSSEEDSDSRNMRYDDRFGNGSMRDEVEDLMFDCGFNTDEAEAAYKDGLSDPESNDDLPKPKDWPVPKKFNSGKFKTSKLGEFPDKKTGAARMKALQTIDKTGEHPKPYRGMLTRARCRQCKDVWDSNKVAKCSCGHWNTKTWMNCRNCQGVNYDIAVWCRRCERAYPLEGRTRPSMKNGCKWCDKSTVASGDCIHVWTKYLNNREYMEPDDLEKKSHELSYEEFL